MRKCSSFSGKSCYTFKNKIPIVDVLTPPTVEPGAPPMNIKIIVITMLAALSLV